MKLAAALALACCVACGSNPPIPPPRDACADPVPGTLCTVVGTGQRGTNGDGLDVLASHLNLPTAVRFDATGRMIIVDFNNQVVRRVRDDGTLETVVGTGQHAYALHGAAPLETGLENPIDVEVDPDGRLYVMELHGARILAADTAVIEVIVGSILEPGYEGYEGDGGPGTEAAMTQSVGLALAPDGTLYFSDTGNHCIRGVDTLTGVVDTLSGNGQAGLADGPLDLAMFAEAQHIAWHDDALYVADAGNHAIRRIDLVAGTVTTLAGTGEPGFAGDGGPGHLARLDEPQGVAVAPDGTVFVADTNNHVVRRIDVDGTITTVAGEPRLPGYAGDGGPAADATLNGPTQVTWHQGDLYVADTLNSVVRRVSGVR